MMVKAVAGGGGRGMRPVTQRRRAGRRLRALRLARPRRRSATATLYVEQFLPQRAPHRGADRRRRRRRVSHLWDRECSLQRQRQKIVEIAPGRHPAARRCASGSSTAAVALGEAAGYRSLGTFEFLVDGRASFAFIEANAAPAGRAHRHRGGHRPRPGAAAAADRRRRDAGRPAADAGRRAGAARRTRSRCGSTWRPWRADGSAKPAGGMLTRLRAAVRAGRARRWLRLRRLPHQRAASTACSPR